MFSKKDTKAPAETGNSNGSNPSKLENVMNLLSVVVGIGAAIGQILDIITNRKS